MYISTYLPKRDFLISLFRPDVWLLLAVQANTAPSIHSHFTYYNISLLCIVNIQNRFKLMVKSENRIETR